MSGKYSPTRRTTTSGQAMGILFLLLAIGILVWYVNSRKLPVIPHGKVVAPEMLGDIDLEGRGGDAELNKEKNRNTLPDSLIDMSVAEIVAMPSTALDGEGKRQRRNWSSNAKDYLRKQENIGVRVTGYLLRAKESGPESCNGNIDSLRDYHLWLSDEPEEARAKAMIVEITPRWKIVHPEWRLHYLQKLAQTHARIRVEGWLLWDEEHASEVEKSRATQWEIHPVTNLEVSFGNMWRSLTSP